MQKFEKGIAENETDVMPKPRLVPKNHVYYPIKSRSSTAYLKIDATSFPLNNGSPSTT